MKRTIATVMMAALAIPAFAQVAPPSGQKTLAATMNIYAFPTKGQAAAQQSEDEAACYQFAVQNTGTDPFQIQKQSEAQKQQAATAEQLTNFKKAFSVCMQAKNYMVQY